MSNFDTFFLNNKTAANHIKTFVYANTMFYGRRNVRSYLPIDTMSITFEDFVRKKVSKSMAELRAFGIHYFHKKIIEQDRRRKFKRCQCCLFGYGQACGIRVQVDSMLTWTEKNRGMVRRRTTERDYVLLNGVPYFSHLGASRELCGNILWRMRDKVTIEI